MLVPNLTKLSWEKLLKFLTMLICMLPARILMFSVVYTNIASINLQQKPSKKVANSILRRV